MKFLLITTDNANAFQIDGLPPRPPRPPLGVGETTTLTYAIQAAPMIFARLLIGRDDRIRSLGPQGIRSFGSGAIDEAPAWRIDEISIDGEVRCAGEDGSWGVGQTVVMQVTNVGAHPAHFYASWEMEDVH